MKKITYNIIGFIPLIGTSIQRSINFFGLQCSPFMEEFMQSEEYEILMDWVKSHPDQVLTHKMAKQVIQSNK